MQKSEAVQLIKYKKLFSKRPQTWADLGCGSGTFTLALANFLPAESIIYAVDTNKNVLTGIPEMYHNIRIERINLNFIENELILPQTDGVLMANSLHFVEDKKNFLRQLEKLTNRFLIVEYERETPNPWVPFPVKFQSLTKLFAELNFSSVSKIGTRKSAFGGEMYSVIFEK